MISFQPPSTTTPCRACPLRALGVFKRQNPGEVDFIQEFKAGEILAQAGDTILKENEHGTRFFTVLNGWVFRYRTLDGDRRQIINFGLPGDFLGLQATLDDMMSHGIEALTPAVLCHFERDRLWELYHHHPKLAYDLTWLAAQQERSFEEQLLTLGQRTAFERIAYLLWDLFARGRRLGLVKHDTLDLPIRQMHIADTLGLSLVHTNKTLQKIREDGAIEVRERTLRVLDEARLIEHARVEPTRPPVRPLL